jgi:hypothetical protein
MKIKNNRTLEYDDIYLPLIEGSHKYFYWFTGAYSQEDMEKVIKSEEQRMRG